ncbi:MAG: alpha-glucosidase domain-containing protein, partial [Janthinobacterium sp.]
MKPLPLPRRALAACVLAALATLTAPGLQAAPIGNLSSLSAVHAADVAKGEALGWDLRSDTGMQLRVSLPQSDVLRIQAGGKGGLTGPGDKAAPIVVGQPAAQVAYQIDEQPDHIVISTEALSLRIDRKPLRFTLFRKGDAVPLWREVQPLSLDDKQGVQLLSSVPGERYFGGGQQNGRFEFRGKQVPVSYSGGWEEGDRPNPAPFLMSS